MSNPIDELREFCEQNFEDIRSLIIDGQVERPLDDKGAMDFLHIKQTKLRELRLNEDLPVHDRYGKRIYYRSELNDWIRKRNFKLRKAS